MKTGLQLFFVILTILLITLYFITKSITTVHPLNLSIAAGREGGTYYQYAHNLAKRLEKNGFKVKIIQSAGSVENLALLKNKKADIGFVQGGCALEEDKKVLRSIASLYFEPLWLFYDADIKEISYLKQLKPLRVSIGEKGSGTQELLHTLFKVNALPTDTMQKLSTQNAYQAFKEGKLDAFFTVLSPTSPLIKTLLLDKALKVASLKRIPAYEENFSYLRAFTLTEGKLDLEKNIPDHTLHLLTTTAALVTRDDLDNSIVRYITKELTDAYRSSLFPSIKYVDIPMHPEAEKYLLKGESFLEKIFPYWIASNIDKLKYLLIPILTLLIPLFKGIFPLYKWRIRSKIYKWYDDLEEIEKENSHLDDAQKQEKLEQLLIEINEHLEVPSAYKGELYALKLHIDNLIVRLSRD